MFNSNASFHKSVYSEITFCCRIVFSNFLLEQYIEIQYLDYKTISFMNSNAIKFAILTSQSSIHESISRKTIFLQILNLLRDIKLNVK